MAGTGAGGFSGDGGLARDAMLNNPCAAITDDAGNLYIADTDNNRIRRVDSSGRITTIAGTGVAGISGDGGPAIRAQFWAPTAVTIGPDGAVYVTDNGNNRIRKVDPTGTITTVTGPDSERAASDPVAHAEGNVYSPALDVTPIMFDALRVTSSQDQPASPDHPVTQDQPATRVGVPRESKDGERRVALVPKMVEKLAGRGLQVVVEAGAGVGALMPDELFIEAGAVIDDPWKADVVVKVAPPTDEEIAQLRRGSVLIGFLAPRSDPEIAGKLRDAGVTAFAMESIPRISRAQSMDALSSQANVAGYKAVLLAAELSTRFFPMLTTAAGTVKPATALILGVGVAGLQALATAKRLGARTTGYDVRPEVADQVRSLGAKWLDLGIEAAGEGGYARELSEDERDEQKQRLTEATSSFDIVITTALVPGRRAPILVTAEAVKGMRPGSVIVDLAGETGGNCELTEPGHVVVRHDVTIASPLNLPATMPEHASELYARNVQSLLELMVDKEGRLTPDSDDEVLVRSCITREGDDH